MHSRSSGLAQAELRVKEGLEGGEARSGVEGAGPLKTPSINFLSKPLHFRQLLYIFVPLFTPLSWFGLCKGLL